MRNGPARRRPGDFVRRPDHHTEGEQGPQEVELLLHPQRPGVHEGL